MTGANPNDRICLNPGCSDYRKKNTRHIIKKGFNTKGNRMFKCKTCGVGFPETKGKVFYNRHPKEEQIIRICKLLIENGGVRAIERIMEIHRCPVSDVIIGLFSQGSGIALWALPDIPPILSTYSFSFHTFCITITTVDYDPATYPHRAHQWHQRIDHKDLIRITAIDKGL